jgi:hypothetical protein
MASQKLVLSVRGFKVEGLLLLGGDDAPRSFELLGAGPGVHVLIGGHRPFHVLVTEPLDADQHQRLRELIGRRIMLRFEGRPALRRRISAVAGTGGAALDTREAAPVDLTAGLHGANPLWLRADGTLASSAQGEAPRAIDALATMLTAARWVSARSSACFRPAPSTPTHPSGPSGSAPIKRARC